MNASSAPNNNAAVNSVPSSGKIDNPTSKVTGEEEEEPEQENNEKQHKKHSQATGEQTQQDKQQSVSKGEEPEQDEHEKQEKALSPPTQQEPLVPVPPMTTWMEEVRGEIQPMPIPPPRRQRPELMYDNQGRVLKSSYLQNYSGPTPGAYATQSRPVHPPLRYCGEMTTIHQGNSSAFSNSTGPFTNSGAFSNSGSFDHIRFGEHARRQRRPSEITHDGRRSSIMEARVDRAKSESTMEWLRTPCLIVGMMGIMFIALSVVIPAATMKGMTLDDPTPEGEQISPPTTTGAITKKEFDLSLVPNITNATLKALEDPFSQQYRAFDFVSKDPNWHIYDDWQKQQRFIMACFCYAFAVDTGVPYSLDPQYVGTECLWISGFNACQGNENERGKVTVLGLPANGFINYVGTIPPEIAFLSHLEELDMAGLTLATIDKMLPVDIMESLPPIKALRLHDCELKGTIPSTLGLLTSLTSLDLSKNGLTGHTPMEIGNLPSLKMFNIEDNPHLEPTLPLGFCNDTGVLAWESLQTDWCSSPSECCPRCTSDHPTLCPPEETDP